MSIASRAAMSRYKQPNQQTPTALRRGAFRRYLHVSVNCVAAWDQETQALRFVVPRGKGVSYRPNLRKVTA